MAGNSLPLVGIGSSFACRDAGTPKPVSLRWTAFIAIRACTKNARWLARVGDHAAYGPAGLVGR